MNRRLAVTAALLCLLCPMFSDSALAGTFANGKDLIRAMYEMYRGKWYSKLTIEQKVTYYRQGKAERDEV